MVFAAMEPLTPGPAGTLWKSTLLVLGLLRRGHLNLDPWVAIGTVRYNFKIHVGGSKGSVFFQRPV